MLFLWILILFCYILFSNSDFTPTKALKYNRTPVSVSSTQLPAVHSAADLNSVGSTANSSTSSLHAYSVSNARPLRSGSMDDVRMVGNTSGKYVCLVGCTRTNRSALSMYHLQHPN